MTGSVGLGASGRGAKELMEVSSWYRMGSIQAQNRPATKSLNWFKEKSAGTADILFSHLGQKTHGFPATISTFGRCPKSLWSSTWVCLNPNMGALSKREHEDSPFPGCSSSNFGFTKNMEMS